MSQKKQSRKNRKIQIISVLLCVVTGMSFLCSGCGKKETKEDENGFYLYYTNKERTELTFITYEPQKTATLDLIKEVLEQMNKALNKPDMVTAKPENVIIKKYDLANDLLTIDFSASYLEMGKVEEVLCRSAIVLTLTQIKGVEYVAFTVEGLPLLDSQTNPVGSMKASDFVDTEESNINNYQQVRVELYFADSTGKKLEPVTYEGICDQNTSVEKLIIEKLIEGPTQKQYQRTLPSNVRLLSVLTKDGICYVNFNANFLTESVDVSPELELYSIVNSLAELSYINKVQISVNGDINKKLRDEISLNKVFSRNLDVVK